MIAPGPRDIVIKKQKPSGFFGTSLASYLTLLGCDSVIVVGTTTLQPLRQSRRLAQPLRFRQAGRRDVAHCDIAGFRHQLADQLAAHSAAAAGDYRGPPSEFGHVRPPLRAGADPDMALQTILSAGAGGIVISRSSDGFYHLTARGGSG